MKRIELKILRKFHCNPDRILANFGRGTDFGRGPAWSITVVCVKLYNINMYYVSHVCGCAYCLFVFNTKSNPLDKALYIYSEDSIFFVTFIY